MGYVLCHESDVASAAKSYAFERQFAGLLVVPSATRCASQPALPMNTSSYVVVEVAPPGERQFHAAKHCTFAKYSRIALSSGVLLRVHRRARVMLS